MSYHISSCKTVILYFIIYCIFISFYSSVKNFIVLVRLMNYFFIQYVISTINLWVFFFTYSNCQAGALKTEFLCPFDISSSVF